MATRAFPLASPAPRASVRVPALAIDAALMLAAALILRCWWFGDPVVQIDEQFYLLVGDRMLHGAVPFVDIWDRKPVGLFLAYAAVRLLGGDGILQYQLVATVLAAGAALLVVRVARLHAGEAAARLAGVASLMWLLVFDGAGGQAPVFYAPLVAGAALLTLRTLTGPPAGARALFRVGAGAMLLVGVAMQIKYTAMFEGIGFALMLTVASWRRFGLRTAGVFSAAWAACALLPTAAAFLWYDLHGWRAPFLYANFVSIGQRPPTPAHLIVHRLVAVAAAASALLVCAGAALVQPCPDEARARARRLVALWALAGLVGFLGIGTFFKHYFLPAIPPLCALGAAALDSRPDRRGWARWWPAALVFAIGLGIAGHAAFHRWARRGGGDEVRRIATIVRPRLNGALFVFDGEPILYHLTGARLPTPFVFPNHLNEAREAHAIGIDPVAEVRRILAARPGLIIGSDRPDRGYNRETLALVQAALARGYRPILQVPIGKRVRIVYQRIG